MDGIKHISSNFKKLIDNKQRFKGIFGMGLASFWSNITGFDIVELDKWLEVPSGTSTKEFITKKYGKDATEFVESLI